MLILIVFVFYRNNIKSSKPCSNNNTETEVAEIQFTPKFELKLHSSDSKLPRNIGKQLHKGDDVFIWENPLHKSSPNLSIKNIQTPDEQADLDYDKDSSNNEIQNKSPSKLAVAEKNKVSKLIKESNVSRTDETNPTKEISVDVDVKKDETNEVPIALTNSCEEVTEAIKTPNMLPPPNEFGGGNPFLMFLCITVLLQHRNHIISKAMDYNEMAMHFDKMVRKHNVNKVLNQARQMYAGYIKQHTMAQQKIDA